MKRCLFLSLSALLIAFFAFSDVALAGCSGGACAREPARPGIVRIERFQERNRPLLNLLRHLRPRGRRCG